MRRHETGAALDVPWLPSELVREPGDSVGASFDEDLRPGSRHHAEESIHADRPERNARARKRDDETGPRKPPSQCAAEETDEARHEQHGGDRSDDPTRPP